MLGRDHAEGNCEARRITGRFGGVLDDARVSNQGVRVASGPSGRIPMTLIGSGPSRAEQPEPLSISHQRGSYAMGRILTRQQIGFWHENGYLEPIRFAPEEEIAGYVSRLEAFERAYPEHIPKLDVKAHLLCGWVNDLAQNTVLLDVMEDLLGSNLLLTGAAFRIKPPDGRTFAE